MCDLIAILTQTCAAANSAGTRNKPTKEAQRTDAETYRAARIVLGIEEP